MAAAIGLLLCFSSCKDDSGLQSQVDELDKRVKSLETLCAQMNSNISALQATLTALQNNDYITGLSEVKEGNTVIGYTLTFAKNGAVTIYHGKEGKTPLIGLTVANDDKYYWTLNGDWLLDSKGAKIKAQGIDGENGTTPQLKIENDYWYISTDSGNTWMQLNKATGEKGEKGDSFFESVTQDEANVYLKLIDGTLITLPKEKLLSISFAEPADISITAGASKTLDYSITGATGKTVVKALGQNGWSAKVTPKTNATGTITVTAPDPLIEDEILVWVYDGETKTIMSSLNFIKGTISVASNAYSLSENAGTQEVAVNTDIDYTVSIPAEAQSWLSLSNTRSAMRTETLTFYIAKNPGLTRYATVSIKNNSGKTLQTIAFEQAGGTIVLNVATPGTLSSLLTSQQKQNLQTLTVLGTLNNYDFLFLSEMASLETLDMSAISNTELPAGLFKDNKRIREVKLPDKLTSIPDNLFRESSIQKCVIPDGVTTIGEFAFYYSNLSRELKLPVSLVTISNFAFSLCYSLTGILKLPERLKTIGYSAFQNCEGFSGKLIIPNSVTSIDNSAFSECSGFTGDLIIPKNVTSIGNGAFNECTGIEKIYSKNSIPIYFNYSNSIFPNSKYLGVPKGSKEAYQEVPIWRDFIIIEEVDFDALGL